MLFSTSKIVVPAKAGTHQYAGKAYPSLHNDGDPLFSTQNFVSPWIPAFAGMTMVD